MKHAFLENREAFVGDKESLKFAEHFSQIVTVIDRASHEHYLFRTFLWMGNWGICNASKNKIIVKAKANYLTAEILVALQLLIAGSSSFGWDVYSLNGEFLRHLPHMSLNKAKKILIERYDAHH